MDCQSWPAFLAKVLGDVVCNPFRGDKDQDFGILFTDFFEMASEFRLLLEWIANFDDLRDIVISSEFHRADVNLDHISEKILQEHER